MSKNQGKGGGGGGNQNVTGSEPPDENHRKMVKGKMIEILNQFNAINNNQGNQNMDVEGIEKKIFEKVMREQKTKDQYNQIINQLIQSLKKKTELANQRMSAGLPGQQQQQLNQQQGPPMNQQPNNGMVNPGMNQQPMNQGMAQHLRPQVPPHMAQQLIGGTMSQQQQQQPPNNVQQQQNMVPVSMAGGQGQMMMNSAPPQMGPGQPMNQGMMPNQGIPGHGQMMGPGMNQGPPMGNQMMAPGMGPGGPMNPQQMGMNNQDPMSALKTMAPDPGQRMRMPGPPPGHPGNDLRPAFSPQTRFNNPNSPQVGGQWTPGQGNQGGQGMAPSPRPMMGGQGPPSNSGMPTGMSPMPAYFNNSLNTPAPIQMGNSPSAPSPGPPPQFNSGQIGPGPSGTDPYLMKLQELSKYIEPLRIMVQRIQSDTSKADSKELVKIKQLLNIISNQSNNRVDFDTLRKCEDALEKMNLKMKSNLDQREQHHQQQQQQQLIQQQQQQQMQQSQQMVQQQSNNVLVGGNICQPLLDAFKEGMKRPNFSSFLSKTFGPAVAALGITSSASDKNTTSDNEFNLIMKKRKFVDDNGDNVSSSSSDAKRSKDLDAKVVIEGEIARLDSKFKVQPDPLSHPGSDSTQVIATLDTPDLPYVPPVIISIPSTYPNHPPTLMIEEDVDTFVNPFLDTSSEDENAIPFGIDTSCSEDQFFKRVNEKLELNMKKLPKLHSLTSLLQTWEMSVRQACHKRSC